MAASIVAGPRPATTAWHGCRTGPDDAIGRALDAAGAQCGEITVALDYRHPGGRTITVAMSRILATDPAHRRGVLFINPGGPGAPGREQVLINQFMPAVAAHYDLIGMDPRFVGRSTPLTCAWTTDTFLRSAGSSFAESVALARTLAAGCVDGNRDVLPFASTRNTARDMDALRVALGERRISYLGVSYGTYLGAVYLQMFGAHADRFALDSAVDPDVYGPDLFLRNGPADAAALAHWATWAAGHGLPDALSTVDSINRAALRHPLRLGAYEIDSHVLPYILFAHLYDDSDEAYAGFAADVTALDRAAHGVTVEPRPELAQFLDGVFTGSGAATDRAGTPILCADRAVPHDPRVYRRDIEAHRADEPLFGPLIRNITPCAFWPTAPVEAPTTIANSRPVLIVGADGDPAAPFAGQLAMHRALRGSRLVTLTGAFRHGVFVNAGSACVDTAVTTYLVDGALPGTDVTCRRG